MGKWTAEMVECRVCDHRHAAVSPLEARKPYECPNCGRMACEAVASNHDWVDGNETIPYEHCCLCGVIKNDGNANSVCRGPAKVRPRGGIS